MILAQLFLCPPFATLALVKTAGGGAYTRDATFSLAIMPPLNREMFSGSVDADFVLALSFYHRDLEPDCIGVSTRGEWGPSVKGETSPSVEHEAERWCQRYR